MDFYIPEVLLSDYERMAQHAEDRKGRDRLVLIQANVLLGLIRTYRAARERANQPEPVPPKPSP